MLDVTLGGDKIQVNDWKYLNEDSLSDHAYIKLELETEHLAYNNKIVKVPKLINVDKTKFQNQVETKIKELNISWPNIKSHKDMDSITKEITNIISNSAKNSILKRNKKQNTNLDFWSLELLNLRTTMRKDKDARDNYLKINGIDRNKKRMRNEMSPVEIKYIDSKRVYQQLLRLNKENAFKNFCTINMN